MCDSLIAYHIYRQVIENLPNTTIQHNETKITAKLLSRRLLPRSAKKYLAP